MVYSVLYGKSRALSFAQGKHYMTLSDIWA